MREKQNTPDKKNQKNALTPLVIQSELCYNKIMTNNNNVSFERLIMKFQVLRTIVRSGEWMIEMVAEFATEAEANACAKRCHNGNPTTRVVKR